MQKVDKVPKSPKKYQKVPKKEASQSFILVVKTKG
jgi:hypothetical protein